MSLNNFDPKVKLECCGFIEQLPFAEKKLISSHSCELHLREFGSFFDDLHCRLQQTLVLSSTPVAYALLSDSFVPGERILERAESAQGIYLILRGCVHSFYRYKNRTISLLEKGEYFGDICLLGNKSRVSYEVTMDTICMFLPLNNIKDHLEDFPQDLLMLKRKQS